MAKAKTARKVAAKGKARPSDDTEGRISGADFAAWRASLGLTKKDAAGALGISANSVPTYEADGGPRSVALACAALAAGLGPYSAATAKRVAALKALNEALDG